ncbi:MAG TPA: hypothetical protein VLJ61_16510 [Pyrinomonadaceae bacterium]|nr:hypothetical protein [Pyrinomonadaceae bacterium]
MKAEKSLHGLFLLCFILFSACAVANAQRPRATRAEDSEFGPNVRAYLGYLRDEQEVVDDRVSRREIKREYYVHNSNRIYALRQMAIRLARASKNDYLPELEAVSTSELDQLFDEPPPKPSEFQVGEVLEYKLKYLGTVASRGEKFYLFARLDPYEQAELRKKAEGKPQPDAHAATAQPAASDATTRPRRVNSP